MIEIYVAGRGKTKHLLVDPPTLMTDDWTLDDNVLLLHILNTMEPKIQDSVLHCIIVKELWCFLKYLYGRSGNINRAYEVIQELFQKKQDDRIMDAHYSEFNRLAKEFRQIFFITSDVKHMRTSGTS